MSILIKSKYKNIKILYYLQFLQISKSFSIFTLIFILKPTFNFFIKGLLIKYTIFKINKN